MFGEKIKSLKLLVQFRYKNISKIHNVLFIFQNLIKIFSETEKKLNNFIWILENQRIHFIQKFLIIYSTIIFYQFISNFLELLLSKNSYKETLKKFLDIFNVIDFYKIS